MTTRTAVFIWQIGKIVAGTIIVGLLVYAYLQKTHKARYACGEARDGTFVCIGE